jgi:ubiquitin C-terminal hydrolase
MELFVILISFKLGMSVIDETTGDESKLTNNGDTRYKLVGIIVHSGQANGGHYYSFIQNK